MDKLDCKIEGRLTSKTIDRFTSIFAEILKGA
jgi:hypothetical protein